MAELKAQVLERIEVLETRGRERQELLAELTAMAQDHGLDAGPLKAILSSWLDLPRALLREAGGVLLMVGLDCAGCGL